MTKKILLIGGSLNLTTIMHKIALNLRDYECYFTPFYSDGLLNWLSKGRNFDFPILGGRHRKLTQDYLQREHLPVDFSGKTHDYDLVITGTDVIIQQNLLGKRLVLVQEGMIEPEDLTYQLVKYLKLPHIMANTAFTGLSDAYDIFCVASQGYRDLFIKKGVAASKIVPTGIPNFDYATQYLNNSFPLQNYVLAVPSNLGESFKAEDRMGFLEKVRKIANGRMVIIKLHPNENFDRARKEIEQVIPDSLVLTEGNVHEMIANCEVLITQRSSVVYTGIALGKEVYSEWDIKLLQQLAPVQSCGKSAYRIAQVCRQLIEMSPARYSSLKAKGPNQPQWIFSDQLS